MRLFLENLISVFSCDLRDHKYVNMYAEWFCDDILPRSTRRIVSVLVTEWLGKCRGSTRHSVHGISLNKATEISLPLLHYCTIQGHCGGRPVCDLIFILSFVIPRCPPRIHTPACFIFWIIFRYWASAHRSTDTVGVVSARSLYCVNFLICLSVDEYYCVRNVCLLVPWCTPGHRNSRVTGNLGNQLLAVETYSEPIARRT